MAVRKIEVPRETIAAFCERWKIREFSLFGSVLRDDFRPDSDIDVLVGFREDAAWGIWEFCEMQEELAGIFGRKVDLVAKDGLRNPFRRHEILRTREVLYAA